MATPSNYGYNYHQPKREIVVYGSYGSGQTNWFIVKTNWFIVITNWTRFRTGGPTLQDGQISYTEFLGATLNLDEAQRRLARCFRAAFLGWKSMAISEDNDCPQKNMVRQRTSLGTFRNHHYDTFTQILWFTIIWYHDDGIILPKYGIINKFSCSYLMRKIPRQKLMMSPNDGVV